MLCPRCQAADSAEHIYFRFFLRVEAFLRTLEMWAHPRPLRHVSFAGRVAFPGVPVVWCVLFVQLTTNKEGASAVPMTNINLGLAGAYVLLALWYGTLRELTAYTDTATRRSLKTLYALRTWTVRACNMVADAGAALCFLFFTLLWFPAAWFAPLFFVTLLCHAVTEAEVEQRLRALHAHNGFLSGRRPTQQEMEALSVVPDDVHVTVQPV